MVSDWYHQDYFTLVNQTMQGNFPPSNNNLINGKMNYPCENTTLPCAPNAGISKFQFTSGKKHLVRIVNTGAEGTQKFSIDNHTLTVIANDFIPVVPYTTNVVTVGVGQRTDVIVGNIFFSYASQFFLTAFFRSKVFPILLVFTGCVRS